MFVFILLTKPLGPKPENLLTLRLFAVHVQPAIATKPIVSLGWLTEIGIATVNLLRMNRPQLVEVLSQTTIDVQQRNHAECKRLKDEQRSLARQMRDDHAKLQAIAANPNIASNLSGLSEIQSRLETADRRTQQITSELAVLEAQKIDAQQITNVLASFDDLWQTLPPKEQVRLVQLLIQSVRLDGPGGNVAITFHPTGLKSLTENQLEHAQ